MLDRPLPGPKHLQHRVDPPQAAEVVITVGEAAEVLLVVTDWEAAEVVEVTALAVWKVKVNLATVVEVTVEVTVIEVSVIEASVARAG